MKTTLLLRHLNAPVRLLTFTLGEWISYLAPFFMGALLDSLFFVPMIGFILVGFTRKWIKRFPRFYAFRLFYWFLPTHRFNRILRLKLPPSNQRLWIK